MTGGSRKEPEHRQDGHKFQEENIKNILQGQNFKEKKHMVDGQEFLDENKNT